MWDGLSAQLNGKLVVLEPLQAEHETGLLEAAQDMDWTWMPVDAGSAEPFALWLEHSIAQARAGSEVVFATIDAGTGRPIGSTRFMALRPEHRGLEIGATWLRRSAWRSGANVEAKLLMLEHAFERHGCIRVEFKTDARNQRSRRALEALPARFEGIFRKHMVVQGRQLRDSAWYAITDEEWPAVRANLERRLAERDMGV
jgi:N-acetyltransferase